MHQVFAVSGVLMLLSTIWMFAADHSREWKPIQRTANRVEITMTDWRRLQFETEEAIAEHRELVAAYQLAQREALDAQLLGEFQQEVDSAETTADLNFDRIDQDNARLVGLSGQEAAEGLRSRLLDRLSEIVRGASFREDTLLGRRKFVAADRDKAVAALGLMVRDGKPLLQQNSQQLDIDQLKAKFEELTRQYQEVSTHRKRLESLVNEMTQSDSAALEALDNNRAELETLEKSNVSRRSTYFTWYGYLPLPGKKWLELPILDAFNSPRKIDNLWSDGLMIDYNFSKVRRFDRCTTCHQLIQKTLPGAADQPGYEQEQLITLVLAPPELIEEQAAGTESEVVVDQVAGEGEPEAMNDPQRRLEKIYGLRLAFEGLLKRTDVTVQYVRPESLSATAAVHLSEKVQVPVAGDVLRRSMLESRAAEYLADHGPGLKLGDVIVEINADGNQVYDTERVIYRLLDAAESGEEVVITVRRGMPSPFSSHPRLDLFVGSMSPHKMADFACTICHEGQGSATAFKWASHYPDSVRQRQDWSRDYGWFDNHHWIYPMNPQRFTESSCLKCHHDVVELEPSKKFPDPPAPNLMKGYDLVRKYGCYGCHEITGYDGPKRVGPDMRLEPNVFAAALQLQQDANIAELGDEVVEWARTLVQQPENDDIRRRLYEVLLAESEVATPVLSHSTHTHITPLFKDVENPGQLRKAGPSLRFVANKVGAAFLFDWIREPKHFRPSTRMPQFFGQLGHLEPGGESRQISHRYEPVEIQGIVRYLDSASQNFEYLHPPENVAEPSIERGKILFEERGCLACHNHKDFPDTAAYRAADEIIQGPDLSGVGDKLTGPDGQKWLYSWIKEPSRYHARTVMPDLFLDPIQDADGNRTDPAGDVVAYLLNSSSVDWEPRADTPLTVGDVDTRNLNDLTLEHLKDVFSEAAAEKYVVDGIPPEMRNELRGAEVELVLAPGETMSVDKKLNYIGRKTIAKYGCYGCHDIAGFEDAKTIGTGLADWGLKNPSQLAFEHINHVLEHEQHAAHGDHDEDGHASERVDAGEVDDAVGADHDWYVEQIAGGHRAGFIYQKLRDPRSYDYRKTENKKYNERLRMPKFPFGFGDREAVITFVLGLVADPPSEKYIYQPTESRKAILDGERVLKKYNCAGCHVLEPQKWAIRYEPDRFGEQPATKTYPFIETHVPTDELADSLKTDLSGLRHAVVTGMPTVDDTGAALGYDDYGDPVEDDLEYNPTKLEFPFDIWRPAALDGDVYEVGVLPLNLTASEIGQKYQTRGGFLSRYLLPRVVAREKQVNPAAKGAEAWGWVPPPLIGEGAKVQTDWLHQFLLNPFPIRPAVVLRMPKFNMSTTEATQLVNYFAAVDNVEYPYAYSSRQLAEHLHEAAADYQALVASAGGSAADTNRFNDAMKVVTNNNYCVKCHLVGDFEPKGADQAKAPDLSVVYRRLRPDFMRKWIANPKSILPYTSMPTNIPYDPDAPHLGGVSQDLFHGTSIDQLDGLVDLLMNFDQYAKQRSLISPLVQEAPPPEEEAAAAAGGEAGG
jgi:hypothetical protein